MRVDHLDRQTDHISFAARNVQMRSPEAGRYGSIR